MATERDHLSKIVNPPNPLLPLLPGWYQSDLDGSWWCDNCDQWPCDCAAEEES